MLFIIVTLFFTWNLLGAWAFAEHTRRIYENIPTRKKRILFLLMHGFGLTIGVVIVEVWTRLVKWFLKK
jgi:hypothetical protein